MTSRRVPTIALSGTIVITLTGAATSALAAPQPTVDREDVFRGQVDVVEGPDEDQDTIDGVVFDDRNQNSRQDARERGLKGVTVSNGEEVVTTDKEGRYQLPARDGMTVFVTQPRGYAVPLDDDNVAQFYYHHLQEGSPELRYGGLEPTGPLPDEVNFPVARSRHTLTGQQRCLIAGDLQTYDVEEVGFAREGAIADLAARDDYQGCGALFLGDVVGDDLSLYDEVRGLVSQANGPVRFLPGNHDLDFDTPDRDHRFDTFKAQLGPDYYSYDSGTVHVVALNTVDYPTRPDPRKGDYNGMIDERQLEWLRQDIASVPRNRAIVLASHIPLLDFADQASAKHQVDQVQEIYDILEGREVIAVAGHTHSLENMREGDAMSGWNDLFGVDGLPFTHITSGAISGDWYSGRVLPEGYPTAVQRDGAYPGLLTLDIRGNRITDSFDVRGEEHEESLTLSLNTPRYREYFEEFSTQRGEGPEFEDADVATRADLEGTTWLVANLFMGSTGSEVEVSIDGGPAQEAVRTQPMEGEDQLVGAEWSDPAAVTEQIPHGGSLADRSMHLWRLELPTDLAAGEHTATVTGTDVHGREVTRTLTFEVTEG